jgi:hypothetical protein
MTNARYGEPSLPKLPGHGPASRLTAEELQRAVWEADPAAFLVLPRILRRVIKQDRRLVGFGLRAPHRKSYVIGREPLLEIAEKAELGLDEYAQLPEKVILLAQPAPHEFADLPAADLLIRCWRLLFHARIHLAWDEGVAAGRLTPVAIRRRIQAIGSAEFDEARSVLGQEELLLPPRSDEAIYAEFVATYAELRWFVPSFLPRYFPGLTNLEAVDALVEEDVDAEGLFLATRPAGAGDPQDTCELDEWADSDDGLSPPYADLAPPPEAVSEAKCRFFIRRAQRPAALGNVVRSAICYARARRCAPPEMVARMNTAIQTDVYRLACRLRAALHLDRDGPEPWRESLLALVKQTPRGIWTIEARLLYDLQKACVDYERDVYTVDVVEWALSWGRRPIKRPLPNQRDVLMLKHLRSAERRLGGARISEEERRQLARLVSEGIGLIETRLRQRLRPAIAAALDEVELRPQNLPERVARKKLVEELLDRIVDRGFATMGDLRDAISRNNLKLPDLSWPFGLFHGDQLLRADRKLAIVLDGVYRRGEFYLRWMQRASSLGFGTRLGRLLTRFAVVPFGGAYVTLAFVQHVWELVKGEELGAMWTWPLATGTLVLGLFLLCLFNSAAFRKLLGGFFTTLYWVFRGLVIEPIRWALQSPLLQRIFHSRIMKLGFRFLIKPLFWTAVACWLLRVDRTNWRTSLGAGVPLFLTINLLLNSRVGRTIEEVIAEAIVQGWRRFGLRLIVGLFWFFVDLFRRITATIERLMYTVDEWLRFRSGETRVTLAAKAALGLVWFFVAYVLRFAVNVLIEPQINPIKHFPVVTVAHKLLFAAYKPFADLLEVKMGMSAFGAWAVAGGTIWGIPGIFGFLVWELKENWRLYAANRRPTLYPVMIGSHGENMGRLLRPGFHSGTLPKRFAKLRRAERHARADGSWRAVRKHVRTLAHAEKSVRRWVEREFLELFAESRCWQLPPVRLERVRLSTNSVRLALECPAFGGNPLQIALEAESGWLLAGVYDPGWIGRLQSHQRLVLMTAIIGLYKSAGVELVRQQIESELPPPAPWYDVSAEGLVVWPDREGDVEVLYDLSEEQWIAPQAVRGLSRRRMPTIDRQRLIFSAVSVAWWRWVEAWNQDIAGQGHPHDGVVAVCVLPPGPSSSGTRLN